MPILPGPESLGGEPTPNATRAVATIDNPGAVGNALRGLGQTMEQAAQELHDSWQQNQAVSNAARYEKLKTDNEMAFTQSVTQAMPDGSLGATPVPPGGSDPLAPPAPAGGAPTAAAADPNAPAPAAGFTTKTIADFTATGRAFLNTITDPKEKAKYAVQLMGDRESIFNRAYQHETTLRDQQALITANAGMQPVLANLAMEARRPVTDPTVDDKGKADALVRAKAAAKNLLDSTPGLLPGKRLELQATMDRAINGTFMESLTPPEQTRLVQQKGSPAALGDPAGGKAAVSSYVGRDVSDADYELLLKAVHGESDGDATESAMIAASILNRSKDSGKSIHDVLYAYRQFQAVTGTDDNGHAPNSNFVAGPKGKARATIEGALAGIMPGVDHGQNDFTAANPKAYGAGTDVGYLHKMQAAGGTVIGGTIFNTKAPTIQPIDTSGTTDQYFDKSKPAPVGAPYGLEGANFDDRQKYATAGENKLIAQANQDKADAATARTANVAEVHDNLMNGIIKGEITDPKTIDESGLPMKEQNSLLEKLISTNAEAVKTGKAVARLDSGEQFNPLDAKDRVDANLAYKYHGGPEKLFDPDADVAKQAAGVLGAFYRQSGIIPDLAMDAIRNRTYSNDPNSVERSLNLVNSFLDGNPAAFDGYPSGHELATIGDAYKHLTNDNGLSGEAAAKQIIASRDPVNIRAAAQLKTASDDFEKKLLTADVVKPLTTSWFLGINSQTPLTGYTPGMDAAMGADYREAALRHFNDSKDPGYGDETLSRKAAITDLIGRQVNGTYSGGLYGVSMVSDKPVLMKYPPERYYPLIGGNTDYLKGAALTQAQAAFNASGAAHGTLSGDRLVRLAQEANAGGDHPDIQSAQLISTPDTAADIRAGTTPRYLLAYTHVVDGQEIREIAPLSFQVPLKQLQSATSSTKARDAAAQAPALAEDAAQHQSIIDTTAARAARGAAAFADPPPPPAPPPPPPPPAGSQATTPLGVNLGRYSEWSKAQPPGADTTFGAFQKSSIPK